jgi:predicted nucleic acid-binding protein
MIFVDSNIPMYLVGAAHPLKKAAQTLLEKYIEEREPLVTDAEVFQEILHRYVAIGRREAIQPAFEVLLGVVDEIFSVYFLDIARAREIVFESTGLSARDAVHLAIMERHGIHQILSFDSGFDQRPNIARLHHSGNENI